MTKRTWTTAIVLTAIGACSVFFSLPVCLGWLLGCAAAVLNYKRNERYWSGILSRGSAATGTGMPHFMINWLIMVAVLLICALKPEYFNIFSCAVGLFLIKITVTVDTLINRKGE
ncbi:MAG: ATP synthase subunit I [Solobacterium sp.]|nr:ATP synthase subunit I [Solobacterium sp.]